MSDLPGDIFGIEAAGPFDRPDMDGVILDFDELNMTRHYRKLLICFTSDTAPSARSEADRFANWVAMREIERAAFVGDKKWHEAFRTFCDQIGALCGVFDESDRARAITWLGEFSD